MHLGLKDKILSLFIVTKAGLVILPIGQRKLGHIHGTFQLPAFS